MSLSIPRVLAAVGRLMITAGAVVLLFVAYQLWGTGFHEARAQDRLESEFEEVVGATSPPSATTTTSSTTSSTAPPPDQDQGGAAVEPTEPVDVEPGELLGRIQAPAIGLDKYLVEGVGRSDLEKAPGHYPSTPLPGRPGNAGIAGHRTTYGQPFHNLDDLGPGDEIIVTTLEGEFTYEVLPAPEDPSSGHFIVRPDDVWVLDDQGDHRLTLTSCHPKYSARERIIVAAVLVEPAEPLPVPTTTDSAAEPGDRDGDPTEDGHGGDDPVMDEPDESGGATDEPDESGGATDEPDESGGATGTDRDEQVQAGGGIGLDGDASARLQVIIWGVLFAGLLTATSLLGKRFGRRFVYPAGLVPLALVMYAWFEQLDRWLPAY